jgi:hypothetical protein
MATYSDLRTAIDAGAVHSFDDFFLFVEQKQFMADTGISIRRLKALRALPMQMSLLEMITIADLLSMQWDEFGALLKKWDQVKQQ